MLSIGLEGNREHAMPVAAEEAEQLAGVGVPDAHRRIIAAAGQQLTIRGVDQPGHVSAVSEAVAAQASDGGDRQRIVVLWPGRLLEGNIGGIGRIRNRSSQGFPARHSSLQPGPRGSTR